MGIIGWRGGQWEGDLTCTMTLSLSGPATGRGMYWRCTPLYPRESVEASPQVSSWPSPVMAAVHESAAHRPVSSTEDWVQLAASKAQSTPMAVGLKGRSERKGKVMPSNSCAPL